MVVDIRTSLAGASLVHPFGYKRKSPSCRQEDLWMVAGAAEGGPAPEGVRSTRGPQTGHLRAGKAAWYGFGGVPQIVTALRELPGRVGRCRALGCRTACARWQP